jgi:nucleotide-binding universal stress UspA family protein
MKILLGHDGSEGADVAIFDLGRSGLPRQSEVLVLTVADVLPVAAAADSVAVPDWMNVVTQRARERTARALDAARANAAAAAARVRGLFPEWTVREEAVADSPAWGIVRRAESMGADLIVVGSHGRGGLARLALGSVSHKVAAEAHGSVRIARDRAARDGSRVRLVIGFDGSEDAWEAIRTVAARTWEPGSAALVITAADDRISTTFASPSHPLVQWVRPADAGEEAWMLRMLEAAAEPLRAAGLDVEIAVHEGDPRRILVEEASRFDSDAIVVGARGLTAVERFLLGSVSQAVLARAACSVEIARQAQRRPAAS